MAFATTKNLMSALMGVFDQIRSLERFADKVKKDKEPVSAQRIAKLIESKLAQMRARMKAIENFNYYFVAWPDKKIMLPYLRRIEEQLGELENFADKVRKNKKPVDVHAVAELIEGKLKIIGKHLSDLQNYVLGGSEPY